MKKTLFISAALIAAILSFVVKPVSADYGCNGQYGQYGGCPENKSISINKTVGKVTTNGTSTTIEYVDNLSPSDPKFKGSDYVFFQLHVKNTSNVTENDVKVTDYVPNYIDPIEGPGSFDSNLRTITFTIPTLNAGEEKVYTVKMQVRAQSQIDISTDSACVTNKASASIDSAYSEDTAQFCIMKNTPSATSVTGVTQVPSTGANDWMPILAGSFVALGLGIYLKKIAKFN